MSTMDNAAKRKKWKNSKKRRIGQIDAETPSASISEKVSALDGQVASNVSDDVATSSEKKSKKKRRRQNKGHSCENNFRSIDPPLSAGILSAIQSYNFRTMTPVQAAVIPLFLKNKDVCVQAVTGSGKTLAFLIPMVEMILRRTTLLTKRQVGGLVISPTRELARQTHAVASDLCRHCTLAEPLLLVGGGNRPVSADLQSFVKLGSDILIATPGRLEDVLGRFEVFDMSELEVLVLDEADVLLDLGFEVTLTNIMSRLPKMRRTGLFSATKPSGSGGSGGGSGVKGLMARAGMRNPVVVNVNVAIARSGASGKESAERNSKQQDVEKQDSRPQQQATPSSLTNYYVVTTLDQKLSRLVAFLRQHKDDKVIVFFLTCACVEFYGAALQKVLPEKHGFYIELLHGKMVQKRREKAMERFRICDEGEGETKSRGGVLLCTDVAARGLDVAGVQWTVQFDAPVDPSSYVHRVGRSARAGKVGSSLIFLTPKEEAYVDFLKMRKVPLDVIPDTEICAPPMQEEGGDYREDTVGKRGKKTKLHSAGKEGNEDEESEEKRIIRSASSNEDTIPDILPEIKSLVLQDRDLLEKGTKAFTSYVRAYKEHHCAFIFRFASLDLGILATSFCLLRLPKMPELKDKLGKLNFKPAGPEVDIYAIKFKDKVREKARQKRLAAELAAGGKNAKQIKAEQRAADKIRRLKDHRATEIAKGRNPNKKRGKQAQIFDEWDELAKEERLYKKLRKGKITKEEYRNLMRGDSTKQKAGDDDVINDSDIEI